MSTPTSNLPTRQQLDEIDALLKRMLSLPSLPGEPAEQPPAPAMSFPAPTIREIAPPTPPQPGEPVVREWRAEWSQPPAPQPPPVVAWGAPVAAAPTMALPPRYQANSPYPPAFAMAVPGAEQLPFAMPVGFVHGQPPPSTAKPPTMLPVRLLEILNQTFNILTYLLGPLGTWLRGAGRNTLGWCGILMLLATGVWAAAEWQGFDWSKINLARFGWQPTNR